MAALTWHVASRWAEPDGTLTPEAMRFMGGLIDELRQISTGGRFAAEEIRLTDSPFSYAAPRRGAIAISGALVLKVVLNRHGIDVPLRPTVTIIPVSKGDKVTITYGLPAGQAGGPAGQAGGPAGQAGGPAGQAGLPAKQAGLPAREAQAGGTPKMTWLPR